MRLGPIALAVAALVLIGSAEAFESVRQLGDTAARTQRMLTPAGAPLTLLSVALSCAVFLTLGFVLARSSSTERAALLSGMAAGVAAGVVGGTIRAFAAMDYVGRIVVGSYGLPTAFLVAVLVVFVILSVLVTAAGGAVLTWLSFRAARRPPTPRPPR